MVNLKEIFERRIRIESKVKSINGVFIAVDETFEKTNYKPSYQRNYVWDDEKATFFIESIFLGTEVPPIIMFVSNSDDIYNYEVIDGRQRYETIKRFLNGDLKLKVSGLQKMSGLSEFVGNSYLDLSEENQALFCDTKIRTIEYSFIGEYKPEEEEAVKREIFQRYNSGITPLKTYEVDKAKYFHNDLNSAIKDCLLENSELNEKVTRIFRLEKNNTDQKVAKLRELLVLARIPIKYYSVQKQKVISRYFEYIASQLDEEGVNRLIELFKKKIDKLSVVEETLVKEDITCNRLYFECLFWALTVLEQNNIVEDRLLEPVMLNHLVNYLKKNKSAFTTIQSNFSRVLVGRYQTIAKFFEEEYNCDFYTSINNNDDFRTKNKSVNTPVKDTIHHNLDELRINKPEPTSIELTELLLNLKKNRFLIRPAYQREEVKNRKKASSIIESLLLGITLPPIFVFKCKNGVMEVIDGQQRLLSILSFIGETYKNQNGYDEKTQMFGFRLDLGENAILKGLNKTYNELPKSDQIRIKKANLFLIEISQNKNPEFDPVDLFVRLNNKPYPITRDSFEMWNSFASREIINLVKQVERNNKWFSLRKNNSRMDNENLLASLAYFQYQYNKSGLSNSDVFPYKTIEIYSLDKQLKCRFRTRNEITTIFYNENGQIEDFLEAVNILESSLIANVLAVLGGKEQKESVLSKKLDELLLFESNKRTQTAFYILWALLHDLPFDNVIEHVVDIYNEVKAIYNMMSQCDNTEVFSDKINEFRKKYSQGESSRRLSLGALFPIEEDNNLVNNYRVSIYNKTDVNGRVVFVDDNTDNNNCVSLTMNRHNMKRDYVKAYLRSSLFAMFLAKSAKGKITIESIRKIDIPYVSLQTQESFINLFNYVEHSSNSAKQYFSRLLDVAFCELYLPELYHEADVHIICELGKFPILKLSENGSETQIMEVYSKHKGPNDILNYYLTRAIDISTNLFVRS